MRKRRFYEATQLGSEGEMVNLTPLIDVVFVVLITFIIIAPLLKLDKIALAPGTEGKESVSPQAKSPISIRVFSDDTISLNSERIRVSELPSHLSALKQKHPNEVPTLFQDQKATFGSYQHIKNALEEAGFEELDVILKP